MAAYAALVSVMQIMNELEHHPHPPISLHKHQLHLLTQSITYLQEFLEGYNNPHLHYSTQPDPLETRIAQAAYAAEDLIESHIVDTITNHAAHHNLTLVGKKKNKPKIKSSPRQPLLHDSVLHQTLTKVIEEMTLIQKEAMQIKDSTASTSSSFSSSFSPSSSFVAQKTSSMVGVDDVLLEMMARLTSHTRDLQIIPVVGMGGTGKTSLARNVYQERLVKEHFDICAWATISQEYSVGEIFAALVSQLNIGVGEDLSKDELGGELYKHLYARRYLIVLDDMWSVQAWDKVRDCFPDNKNGSRIVVTTRLSNLASTLGSVRLEMELLDEANSWDLLCKTVFGGENCPLELEEVGKRIGKSCKGLPLSIVVVGGLLAKSKHSRAFWEHIEENITSIVNSEDDERCLKILYMSYKQLSVHLKPCFLYMGVFREDEVIRVSSLIRFWVAEGFLKPMSGKSLEEVGREYLKELISRNLIMIHKLGGVGNIKECKVHDLLRDLCLREGQKERFYTIVATTPPPQGDDVAPRRIVISNTTSVKEAVNALSSMSQARSLAWHHEYDRALPPLRMRLLRILDTNRFVSYASTKFIEKLLHFVNLRLLTISLSSSSSLDLKFPCSILQLWNLQTLSVFGLGFTLPTGFWCMHHIRHVQFDDLHLPDLPEGRDDIVLTNLQTLGTVKDFKCSKKVVKRFPNIKKLKIDGVDGKYCLSNLDHLDKLESFSCSGTQGFNPSSRFPLRINFPHSLKKLNLDMVVSHFPSQCCWQDILDKIGELPLLQKLQLGEGSFREGQWRTSEGQFRSLKFLALRYCEGLQHWKTESSHFPRLNHLVLDNLDELKEIPLEFGEISTLRVIEVCLCSDSAVVSARRIVEEQEELYGEEASVQVRVTLLRADQVLESLATANLTFIIHDTTTTKVPKIN